MASCAHAASGTDSSATGATNLEWQTFSIVTIWRKTLGAACECRSVLLVAHGHPVHRINLTEKNSAAHCVFTRCTAYADQPILVPEYNGVAPFSTGQTCPVAV